MVYKIRLKAREKQAECSKVLFLSFFITVLTVFSLNLVPLIYTAISNRFLENSSEIYSMIASGVLLTLSAIIYSALSLGCDRFMLKRAENTVAGAGDIFYYFAPLRFLSVCKFTFLLMVYKVIIFVLLSLPSIVCGGVFFLLCVKGFSAAVCSIFAIFTGLFFILSLITFSHICDTYFLVKYRYIKGSFINFRQLISASQNSMMLQVRKLRRMKLSFMGWFILCIFIVPIPYVWSYYRQSKACFASENLL